MKLSKGFYFTSIAAFFWAVSIIVTRIVLKSGENAYNFVFWVTLFASPYWLFVFSGKFKELRNATRKSYLILGGIGLVSTIGVSLVEVFALKYSPAVNYSFLIRSTILFTIIFAYLFLSEKLTLKKIIISILILAGIYLLTTKGKLISLSIGDIFTLIEAMLIAFGNSILGKMATNNMSARLSSSASFLIGVLPIAAFALFSNSIAIPKSMLLIIFSTILSILGMSFRFQAYKHATASYVAMIYSLTPVFVLLMSTSLLRETISPIQLVGGSLIVLGGIAVEKLKI
jgi:drug/metabolite transporter, DME family